MTCSALTETIRDLLLNIMKHLAAKDPKTGKRE